MKISKVGSDYIKFDNGSKITYRHEQECCEFNYADFKQLEELALKTDFNEKLVFEAVNGSGFRFGNGGTQMFFVPCYSEQNGYYTSWVDIYFNNEPVLSLRCEEVLD